MKDRVSEILGKIPKLPGIYMMKDAKNKILYIGKAKSLQARVRSYFQGSQAMPARTRVMVEKVHDIKFLTTATEGEALILESNFIKKHQPRYNVLFKDDKQYPYLRLTTREKYPRLEVVRRVRKDGAAYFGPYTMVKEVRETIRLIYKILPLRQSRDALDGTPKRRPCLNYQMGRCLAPCAGRVSSVAYAGVVKDVVLFLKGKNSELLDSLKEKMDEASSQLRYEEAAALRDKIAAVKTIFDKQKVVSTSLQDQDVVAYHCENGCVMVQVLILRGGKMIGEKNFTMKSRNEMAANEILSSFLKQYYADEVLLPQEIFLPHAIDDLGLIADWLSQKKGGRVRIEVPARGKKRDLVIMAQENARLAIKNEVDSDAARMRMLEELQETLALKSLPQAIEGFDISNISGAYAVGSMVCFSEGKPDKARYRRYKIRSVKGIDDYGMLREVMVRRYARLLEAGEPLPDLVLIDGGKGHLNTGRRVLKDLGLEDKIDLVCIAKGKNRNDLASDEVFLIHRKTSLSFKENSPARFLLQRIRDESHRYAITYHRQLRNKKTLVSPLETISGIGKKRRLLLLKKFGGLGNIRRASLEDLKTVPGISDSLAREISERV